MTMKSLLSACLLLLTGAILFAENTPPGAEVTVDAHIVSAVLSGIPDADLEKESYTALLLDDGSVWRIIKRKYTADEAFPCEGDAVQCTNGSTFYNLSRNEIFFASPMGHATKQPLNLEKIHKHHLISTLQYFLSELIESEDELFALFDPNIDLVLYLLNNDLYYTIPPAPEPFEEWQQGEEIFLVRCGNKETDEQCCEETLINFDRREIREVVSQEYLSGAVKELQLDTLTMTVDQSDGNWNIDPSQLQTLQTWSPGDDVRIVQESHLFADLSEIDESFLWLITMVFGEEAVEAIEGWEITIAIAINLETESTIFCWKWLPAPASI